MTNSRAEYYRRYRQENLTKRLILERRMQRNTRERISEILVFIKETLGCLKCGELDSDLLDFHHIDPESKKGKAVSKNSWESTIRELKKCIVLCVKCHRKLSQRTVWA
jgi:hypothetical protein